MRCVLDDGCDVGQRTEDGSADLNVLDGTVIIVVICRQTNV
jgi:hypothetical protein